jgi:regulatory protein
MVECAAGGRMAGVRFSAPRLMDDFEKYLNKAFHFLSFRPRSIKEVRDSLLKKKASPEIIERVIASLKEHKFLNDEDFARWFVENRLRFNPKGIRIIKMELKQKGIAAEIIDEAIDSLSKNEDESSVPSNDLESAKILVEKKLPKYVGLEKQIIYQKLGAYLARRGFDWGVIKKSIDDALEKGV